MAKILAVGIATIDIINLVTDFPQEDTEVRALHQEQRRGGNATNTLVVLSQLGHHCTWAGTLANDAGSAMIREDLAKYAINIEPVQVIAGGRAPTSYVTLNQQNGSRTIVHYRDLAEYSFETFQHLDLNTFDWIHFEGRNITQTRLMLEHAHTQAPNVPRSLEIEKPRENIESLCSRADLLLYSRYYVTQNNPGNTPTDFLVSRHQQVPTADHICTWSEEGAFGVDHLGKQYSTPSTPTIAVDTLGAGDTFTAGILHGRLSGLDFESCLHEANKLASRKCAQHGFSGLVK